MTAREDQPNATRATREGCLRVAVWRIWGASVVSHWTKRIVLENENSAEGVGKAGAPDLTTDVFIE